MRRIRDLARRVLTMPGELKPDSGAVLILIALLSTALLLFAGLAIDSTILAASRTQQRHIAEYIALGALNAYAATASPS